MNFRASVPAFVCLAASAQAVPILVTHDLRGLAPGEYSMVLELIDRDYISRDDAYVRVSGMSGATVTSPFLEGGVSGDPRTGTLEFRNTIAFNDWIAGITVDSSTVLEFTVDLVSAGVRDEFMYSLIRPDGSVIRTMGYLGTESAGALSTGTAWGPLVGFGGRETDVDVPPPVLTPVPEPASMAALGLALAGFRRSRRNT